MGKLIIKNNTDILDTEVLSIIQNIISQGRISNDGKQYCYCTSIKTKGGVYSVVTDLRKCSDVFTIIKLKI